METVTDCFMEGPQLLKHGARNVFFLVFNNYRLSQIILWKIYVQDCHLKTNLLRRACKITLGIP